MVASVRASLVGGMFLLQVVQLHGQSFRINDARPTADGTLVIRHDSNPEHYFVLLRGEAVDRIATPVP